MRFIGLNAEQGALFEQMDLPEDISIQEVIKRLESLSVGDEEWFAKSFNEAILKSTIEAFKNML
ncbi:MAG: hypothetical protein ACRC68_12010 [Clostridium sp.]